MPIFRGGRKPTKKKSFGGKPGKPGRGGKFGGKPGGKFGKAGAGSKKGKNARPNAKRNR